VVRGMVVELRGDSHRDHYGCNQVWWLEYLLEYQAVLSSVVSVIDCRIHPHPSAGLGFLLALP
ncbi:MAG: hypothetical protein J07HR59_01034, partial [Halorubrum sp. J07HR59]